MADTEIAFTPTQQRIIAKLSDGLIHTKAELLATCFDDNLSTEDALFMMISTLRRRLHPFGQDIVCRTMGSGRKLGYQHVRLLHSANTGAR